MIIVIILGGKGMKKNMLRNELVDTLDSLYNEMRKADLGDLAEDVLDDNNASSDDSGPEGFMTTMSDKNLIDAIREMRAALANTDPGSVQSMIYLINSGRSDEPYDYDRGFIDACKMLKEEYNLPLKGFK